MATFHELPVPCGTAGSRPKTAERQTPHQWSLPELTADGVPSIADLERFAVLLPRPSARYRWPTSQGLGMSRALIIIGLVLVAVGLAWPWLANSGLGRLPGDIVVQRGNTSFYFPIVTCLIVSVVLSLLFWIFRR